MPQEREFQHFNTAEPHRERTSRILRAAPEIRYLISRNASTFLWIVILVVAQYSLAIWVRDAGWAVIVATAMVIGTVLSNGLWVLIHECAHQLIWPQRWQNLATGILANVSHVIPSSIAFQRDHMRHHAFLGDDTEDADLPSRWEVELVGTSRVGKFLWLALCPLFQVAHHYRIKQLSKPDAWDILNGTAVYGADVLLTFLFGFKPLVYLFCSTFFGLGLHPFGARFIQEHHVINPRQETYSYYGSLNLFAFNVGYHTEHHDFPHVPWNRLPALKRMGHADYDGLVSYKSWSRLAIRWIVDPTISLGSRCVRTYRKASSQ